MRKEKKINFFWGYMAAPIFVFIIVVGIHTLWQMERGKATLYNDLYDQGEALIESLRSSAKNTIISNRLVQEILVNRLIKLRRI